MFTIKCETIQESIFLPLPICIPYRCSFWLVDINRRCFICLSSIGDTFLLTFIIRSTLSSSKNFKKKKSLPYQFFYLQSHKSTATNIYCEKPWLFTLIYYIHTHSLSSTYNEYDCYIQSRRESWLSWIHAHKCTHITYKIVS